MRGTASSLQTPGGRRHKAAIRIHRGYWALPQAALHGVVAIGNFDGVHRGHRALIAAAREQARAPGAPLGVIAFEPHPREVLAPESAPPRLRRSASGAPARRIGRRASVRARLQRVSSWPSAEQIVHDVLAGGLGIRQAVVGYDFRFGNRRAGDVAALARARRGDGSA